MNIVEYCFFSMLAVKLRLQRLEFGEIYGILSLLNFRFKIKEGYSLQNLIKILEFCFFSNLVSAFGI